jgi:molybdate transport system substrate-binding protein
MASMNSSAPSSLAPPLTGISSMATRLLLGELTAAYTERCGQAVHIESVGGVDAATRVQAGEAFDVVVLASDAIDRLIAVGHLRTDSKVDLVHSGVAVAVRAGTSPPDISSEDAVRQAVLAASTLSYSTGPSGVALAKLFAHWGVAEQIQPRIVTAPPGVPVGSLVASGAVALGFQQLSELLHVEGIAIVGPLPPAIQITTTFSAAITTACSRADDARALLAYMASGDAAPAKRRQGMVPA